MDLPSTSVPVAAGTPSEATARCPFLGDPSSLLSAAFESFFGPLCSCRGAWSLQAMPDLEGKKQETKLEGPETLIFHTIPHQKLWTGARGSCLASLRE